jgi:hypothetical protein
MGISGFIKNPFVTELGLNKSFSLSRIELDYRTPAAFPKIGILASITKAVLKQIFKYAGN